MRATLSVDTDSFGQECLGSCHEERLLFAHRGYICVLDRIDDPRMKQPHLTETDYSDSHCQMIAPKVHSSVARCAAKSCCSVGTFMIE